ncbi:MAG: hypothetical protein ACK5SQ_05020 [Chitinophagales bacterium]|jgi:hypothetical protein
MSQLNLNLVNSAPSDSPIINLIRELVLLKFRIIQLSSESSPIESNIVELKERLSHLELEYDSHRTVINTNDLHFFKQAIEKSKDLIKSEYQIPIFSSLFPNSSYRTTKRRLEDQLYIKTRFQSLPELTELMGMESFITEIFR